ncbi:hypothetical protein P3S68_018044 [Capsicum galapagoense]
MLGVMGQAMLYLPLSISSFIVLQLPMDIDDPELEESILQHLVVVTSMGRAHHMGQMDGSRNSSSTNEHSTFF